MTLPHERVFTPRPPGGGGDRPEHPEIAMGFLVQQLAAELPATAVVLHVRRGRQLLPVITAGSEGADGDGPRPLQEWMTLLAHPASVEQPTLLPLLSDDAALLGVLEVRLRDGCPLEPHGALVARRSEELRRMLTAAASEALRGAGRDPLTGLVDRGGLMRALTQEVQAGRPLGVLFCDLDRFKLVNDSLGHAAGDHLLVQVAGAITGALRTGDLAARLGGDEFVLLLRNTASPADCISVAERLIATLEEPLPGLVQYLPISTSVSIGIALSQDQTAERLLGDADTALYRAKSLGRGRWELFTPELREAAEQQLRLRQELATALARGQLGLHYQPVTDLHTGVTIGHEALLRWEHPERGLLEPAQFLDTLLDSPGATSLTDWVLEQAIADLAVWPRNLAGEHTWVSVNLSPVEAAQPDCASRVLAALRRHGVEPSRLVVELTEESAAGGQAEAEQLRHLQAAGVRVALDDVGSGYASLAALRDVHADIVKLDRSFTSRIGEARTRAVVRALVELSAQVGASVTAEGIESAEQLRTLQALGVPHGQGWHLGRAAALRRSTAGVHAPARLLVGDHQAELRRLLDALPLAGDVPEVARLAIQAARRMLGVSGGSLVLTGDAETLHTRYAVGYPAEVVNRFREFGLDSPLPLAVAVRTSAPVMLGEFSPSASGVNSDRSLALAALPLAATCGTVIGGIGVSWATPIEAPAAVAPVLQRLAAAVTDRLLQLPDRATPAGPALVLD